MITISKTGGTENRDSVNLERRPPIDELVTNSWNKIAPFWPLKNLVAVNPLSGFEDMTFESALKEAYAYFQQPDIPSGMLQINRESIKWLQAFFDQGQSTIGMPLRNLGFLKSTLSLIRFDKKIHHDDRNKIDWISHLAKEPEPVIAESLRFLGIRSSRQETFLTLMLTTLPGWAGYIQYRSHWADRHDMENPHTVSKAEYLAFRLVLTCLIWPQAKELLDWHKQALEQSCTNDTCATILDNEKAYQQQLLDKLSRVSPHRTRARPDAQMVFCIDVRSEPFRRTVEARGNYETFGVAGFFGLPVAIKDPVTAGLYASCPVLLRPAYEIEEHPDNVLPGQAVKRYQSVQGIKRLYQSLKYTFTTPFSLVETLGLPTGLWMAFRSVLPRGASLIQSALNKRLAPEYALTPDTTPIPLQQQANFAAGLLRTMGLTAGFAPLVVFCGHGSTSQNNAYATALDCGACGGRHGSPNARILAKILNTLAVRHELKNLGISIPEDTLFMAAEHNTTTDQVTLFDHGIPGLHATKMLTLKRDLELAREENCLWRATQLGIKSAQLGIKSMPRRAKQDTGLRAIDWAQVRPEWGLAGNAGFIVAPRWLTQECNLEGRAFLHSYNWEKDHDNSALNAILTAPAVVGQWINAQYLFSTLDNVAYGGGSKVTKNITGKMGIMQGNASDLMHGLPLQSVYKSDKEAYHQPVRLTVVVYAPKSRIVQIIERHETLQRLFGNGWVHMICSDPQDHQKYVLTRSLTWSACA